MRPAAPKTRVDRCCAAACRAAGPPRDSASMVERMLWRHVRARDCTRCILQLRCRLSGHFVQEHINFMWRCMLDNTKCLKRILIITQWSSREDKQWAGYLFIRPLQEGFWWQTSMASVLGNSVFFRTLNQEEKKYISPQNICILRRRIKGKFGQVIISEKRVKILQRMRS